MLRDDISTIPQPWCRSLVWWWIDEWEKPLDTIYRELDEEIACYPERVTYLGERKVTLIVEWESYTITWHYYIGVVQKETKDIIYTEWQWIKYFSLDEILQQPKITTAIPFLLKEYHQEIIEYIRKRDEYDFDDVELIPMDYDDLTEDQKRAYDEVSKIDKSMLTSISSEDYE